MFRRYIFCVLVSVCTAGAGYPLIITEIERNPPGYESEIPGGRSHEYIECANLSRDTFHCDELFLTDGVDTSSLLPFTSDEPRILAPGEIVLILDRDYATAEEGMSYSIDSNAVLWTVESADLCGGLTEKDGFALGMDSGICAAFGTPDAEGKYRAVFPEITEEDAGALKCTDIQDSCTYTAGPRNPGRWDMLRQGVFRAWSGVKRRDSSLITGMMRNVTPREVTFRLFQGDIIRAEEKIPPWQEHVSTHILPLTEEYLLCKYEGGTDTLQVTSWWIPEKSVFISEGALRNRTEWFEICNAGRIPVSTGGWYALIGDDTLFLPAAEIPPRKTVVFSEDSLDIPVDHILTDRFTLNNYAGSIILCGPGEYRTELSWENDSMDLSAGTVQKRSCDEPPFCAAPTPGVLPRPAEEKISCQVYPQVVSPDGDGHQDSLVCRVRGRISAPAKVRIFSVRGRQVRSLPVSEHTGRALWDGCDQAGRPVATGPVMVLFYVNDRCVARREAVLWRD
ncbi:MAG: hypothetical protein ACQEQV_01195 [Fibrobacterota bacterium]